MVLRPHVDSTFASIGETHVPGLMDGEAVKKYKVKC